MAAIGSQRARVVALTEFLSVETVIIRADQITEDMGELTCMYEQKPNIAECMPKEAIIESPIINKTPPKTPIKTIDFGCQMTVATKDAEVNTVFNFEKCVMCHKPRCKPITKSMGIQCSLSEESGEESPIIVAVETPPIVLTKFDEFIKQQSFAYNNDFHECLLCGEVCKGTGELNAHMIKHWGPNELCFKCGRLFESARTKLLHRCVSKKRKPMIMHCTHSQCPVIRKSRKRKLRYCVRDPYQRRKNSRKVKKYFEDRKIKRKYKCKNIWKIETHQ